MGCNTSKDAVQPSKKKVQKVINEVTEKDLDNKIDTGEVKSIEAAATRIQAAFRGHRVRRSHYNRPQPQPKTNSTMDRSKQKQFEAEFRADDPELCKAATTIQNSFRNHLKTKHTDGSEHEVPHTSATNKNDEDFDINDPELNKAATKIQASFRGHQVRKEFGAGGEDEN